MLGLRLMVMHNLSFYNTMMSEIREAIASHEFSAYKKKKIAGFESGE